MNDVSIYQVGTSNSTSVYISSTLIDYDDEHSFSIVDLNRRPPRSPYDRSVGGITALARMIDKGRANNSGTLGSYWVGEDSGFDRRILEFLGLSQEEFSATLDQCVDDSAVAAKLGDRLTGRSTDDLTLLNRTLTSLAPTKDSAKQFFRESVQALDPRRCDIGTFMALSVLDDKVTFARLRALA